MKDLKLSSKLQEVDKALPDELKRNCSFTVMLVEKSPDPKKHASKKPLDLIKMENDPNHRTFYLSFTKNSKHLLKYAQAMYALNELQSSNDGKTYMLGMLINLPYVFLDVDDIQKEMLEHVTGKQDRITKLIELTGHTYSEISQSATGLHFVFRGLKTRDISRKDGTPYELYDANRWMTVTGNCFMDSTNVEILNHNNVVNLENFLWGPEQKNNVPYIPITRGNSVSDKELLQKIVQSNQSEKFKKLWSNTNVSDDSSANDQALANILVWWTNHDLQRADNLFRQSALYREKWDQRHSSDGKTYGEMTLKKADTSVSGGYTDKVQIQQPQQPQKQISPQALFALPKYLHAPHNMKEFYARLKEVGEAWHSINDERDPKTGEIKKRVLMSVKDTCDLLEKYGKFCLIYAYSDTEVETAPLSFYNYDKNIYTFSTFTLNRMVQELNPDLTSDNQRRNIKSTLKAHPKTEVKQLSKIVNPALVCFNNGVFDLKEKKLYPFDPDRWIFTQKLQIDYTDIDPTPSNEPHLGDKEDNGWCVSNWLGEIADGDQDVLRALCEICFVVLFGISDTRQGYFFIDHNVGATGKSTMIQFLSNIIGKDNIADLDITQFDSPAMMFHALGKQAIVGDDYDIDQNSVIRSSKPFKKVVDKNGSVPVWQMNESRWNAVINAPVLQGGNGLPRFADSGAPVYDRMLVVVFKHQYNKYDSENLRVKNEYIYNKSVQQWFVSFLIKNAQHLSGPIQQTQQSINELTRNRTDEDSFESFKTTYLDELRSEKLPTAWMYALYRNSVLSDGYKLSDILSRRKFTQMMTEDKNKTGWQIISKNERAYNGHNTYDDRLFESVAKRAPGSQRSDVEISFETYRGGVFVNPHPELADENNIVDLEDPNVVKKLNNQKYNK